jgi:predicted nucleic acid-binding protein
VTIFVDTNVLLDIAADDQIWGDWSTSALESALAAGPVLINDVVYAELATRYARVEDVDAFVARAGLQWATMPKVALFLAAKAHSHYRQLGGQRTGVLSDFFIGAHAATLAVPLLTRDKKRFRAYFPSLEVIAPD